MKTYNCVIASDFNNICCTINDIINYLQEFYGHLDEGNLFEIKVILNELIMNAVKHGNREDSNKHVKIVSSVTKDGYAFFYIEDEGHGYNYNDVLVKNCPLQDCDGFFDICGVKETGRGMLIVKNLCDKVKFNEKGNKIVVMKKLVRD